MRPKQTDKLLHNKGNHKKKKTYKMGKRQSVQQVLLGKLDSCMQINETRTHPHTMHENKLKMAFTFKNLIRLVLFQYSLVELLIPLCL